MRKESLFYMSLICFATDSQGRGLKGNKAALKLPHAAPFFSLLFLSHSLLAV